MYNHDKNYPIRLSTINPRSIKRISAPAINARKPSTFGRYLVEDLSLMSISRSLCVEYIVCPKVYV